MYFLWLYFLFLFYLASSQQHYPIPSCSNFQFNGSVCSSTPCLDPRCLTCSPLSTADCLLCSSPYNLSRSQGQGSCLTSCSKTQLQSDHYNITSSSTSNDLCLANTNCSDPNCLSCLENSPDVCLICQSGLFPRFYYNTNTTLCMNCSMAMINCLDCAWKTFCLACKPSSTTSAGFLVSDDGSYCQSCNAAVGNCIQCDGSGTCMNCGLGFYLYNDGKKGACGACLSFCDVCSNSTICEQCTNRYFLKDSSTCASCNSYLANCISCDNSTMCDKCELDFFTSNDTSVCENCTAISNGACVNCNGTHCIQCIQNFSLDLAQKSCSPCTSIPNCLHCNGFSCENCSEGFALSGDNRTCLSCLTINNCLICDGVSCIQCQTGYYLALQNNVYQCLDCNTINNSGLCNGVNLVKCKDDFIMQDAFTCVPCSEFVNCSKCNGISCALCKKGNFLYLGNIYISQSCMSCSDHNYGMLKCAECHSENVCKKCEEGYMINPGLQCQMCYNEPNCILCDGYSCIACTSGYYLTPQKTCSSCDDSKCLTCLFDPVTQRNYCQECQSGYYLYLPTFSCIQCKKNIRGQHCNECTYNLTLSGLYQLFCASCDDGFGINLQEQTCTVCSLDNCQNCIYDSLTGLSTCAKCVSGYYLQSDNKTCNSCGIENCLICEKNQNSGKISCVTCSTGSFINSSLQCQTCETITSGCIDCGIDLNSGNIICNQCLVPFYYFQSNQCIICSSVIPNCLECILNNQQPMCISCIVGTYLKNPLNCSNCLVPQCSVCSSMDAGKSCQICNLGYYLANPGTCETCTSSVSLCISCGYIDGVLSCYECPDGYFLNVDSNNIETCQKCSMNCENCTNSTICLKCIDGYYNQISKIGAYCLSQSCNTINNVVDSNLMTCTTCEVLYPDCSTCNNTHCFTCLPGTFLMLPQMNLCTTCQQTNMIILGQLTQCAYQPNVQNLQMLYSLKTGLSNISLNCGAPQIFRVYLRYFITNGSSSDNSVDFTFVSSMLVNATSNPFFVFNQSDLLWTVYLTTLSDQNGNLNIALPKLKNFGVNYILNAWCQNFWDLQNPLNRVSSEANTTWFQNDNSGITIKLIINLTMSLDTQTRQLLTNVLIANLSLNLLNRPLLTDVFQPVITNEGSIEVFYIERDYTVAPLDTSASIIVATLNANGFLSSVNKQLKGNNSNLGILSIAYIFLNSTIRDEQPVFKSVDFTKILNCSVNSANFSLEIINTNGFIYLGFANATNLGDIDWNNLSQGLDPQGNLLNDFNKIYALSNQNINWNWKGLATNQSYTVYFGAINENTFDLAIKTLTYKAVFKAKDKEKWEQ